MEKWQLWKSQAGIRGGQKSSVEGGGRGLHFSCTRVTGNKMYHQVPPRQLQVWKANFCFVSLYPFLDVACLFREVGGRWGGVFVPMWEAGGFWGVGAPLLSEGQRNLFPPLPAPYPGPHSHRLEMLPHQHLFSVL